MQVAFAFLASYGEFTPEGKLHVIGGDIDTLNPADIPFVHPLLYLLAKVILEPSELGRSHAVRVEVLDPDGRPILDAIEGELAPTGEADPEVPPAAALAFGFQRVRFEAAGMHRVRLTLGGEPLADLPLRIKLAATAAGEVARDR